MKVLILGIAGGIARMLAERLLDAGHEVIGIDRRPWPDAPQGIEFHEVDIRKRAAEDVFRKRRPEAVIHMATVTHLVGAQRGALPHQPGGTRAVFDHCRDVRREARRLRRPPHLLRRRAGLAALPHRGRAADGALATFPELADLVAADLYAATALWRMPELTTTVLRICLHARPAAAPARSPRFLRGQRVPMVLGFDPLFQFMHEEDVVDRALARAGEAACAASSTWPARRPCRSRSSSARRAARPCRCPSRCSPRLVGRFGFPRLPQGALDAHQVPHRRRRPRASARPPASSTPSTRAGSSASSASLSASGSAR